MRILLFIILLFSCTSTEEKPFVPLNIEKRANFREALEYVLENEGYYSNISDDRGGETYAGITKKYNKDWRGWTYIEEYKKHNILKQNQYIDNEILNFWVLDFYLHLWISEGWNELQDQQIANYTFDLRINAVQGNRLIKRSLNDLGYEVEINNKIDESIMFYINNSNKALFLNSLKNRRTIYYTNIAKKDSSQRMFLRHWLKRSKI